MRPFRRRGSAIEVRLTPGEVRLLASIPEMLESVGAEPDDPAASRLTYRPHPEDAAAQRSYEEVIGDDLDRSRRSDRRGLLNGLAEHVMLEEEQAEVWLRVIGEARLTIGSRLGIESDWDPWKRIVDAQHRTYLRLTYLQQMLVDALMATPAPG